MKVTTLIVMLLTLTQYELVLQYPLSVNKVVMSPLATTKLTTLADKLRFPRNVGRSPY